MRANALHVLWLSRIMLSVMHVYTNWYWSSHNFFLFLNILPIRSQCELKIFVLSISGCRIVLQDKLNVSHPIYTRPVVPWQWVEYRRHRYLKSIPLLQKIGVIPRWAFHLKIERWKWDLFLPMYKHRSLRYNHVTDKNGGVILLETERTDNHSDLVFSISGNFAISG